MAGKKVGFLLKICRNMGHVVTVMYDSDSIRIHENRRWLHDILSS